MYAWNRTAAVTLLLALPFAAHAREPAAAGNWKLDDLAWLAGGWRGEIGGRHTEEHWTAPADGAMVGMFRMTLAKSQIFELLSLAEEDSAIVMRIRHFRPGLKHVESEALTQKLVELGVQRAVFEGTSPGAPRRTTYERRGDDVLRIVVEGVGEDGKNLEFRLERVKP